MTDNYDGDPQIIIDDDGADIVYSGGQPRMDSGLENNDIIALLSAPGWAGNALLSPEEQIGSDFEEQATGTLTLSKLSDIENSARRALLSTVADTESITVTVTNPAGTTLDVAILRTPPGSDIGELLLSRNRINWINQANSLDLVQSVPAGPVIPAPLPPLISVDTDDNRIYIHDGVTSTILSSFAAPANAPTGLTYDGTNLISCDLGTDLIYIHDGITSTILSSFGSPSVAPNGLTYDGANLVSADQAVQMIYIHDGVTSTILSSFVAPSLSPDGVTYDGTNLISVDIFADLIYIHDGITSTILSSFASPSSAPTGLTYDGTNLISCDNDSDLIYIHDGITSTILSSFASPDTGPSGLTFTG